MLLHADGGDGQAFLAGKNEALGSMKTVNGEAAAYVCRNRVWPGAGDERGGAEWHFGFVISDFGFGPIHRSQFISGRHPHCGTPSFIISHSEFLILFLQCPAP